jgi:hypothetical protein
VPAKCSQAEHILVPLLRFEKLGLYFSKWGNRAAHSGFRRKGTSKLKFVVIEGFLISMHTSPDLESNDSTRHGLLVLSKNLRVGLGLSSSRDGLDSFHRAIFLRRLDAVMPRTTDDLLRLPPFASITDSIRSFFSSERAGVVMGEGRNGACPIMDRREPLESRSLPEHALFRMGICSARH